MKTLKHITGEFFIPLTIAIIQEFNSILSFIAYELVMLVSWIALQSSSITMALASFMMNIARKIQNKDKWLLS
jgi:putative effector of murein hydrolase LrgA (UPF0299 family)